MEATTFTQIKSFEGDFDKVTFSFTYSVHVEHYSRADRPVNGEVNLWLQQFKVVGNVESFLKPRLCLPDTRGNVMK